MVAPAKILVISEDVVFHRLVIQHFKGDIKSNKYDFISAFNGREALKKIESNLQIDLILLDIKVAQIDSLSVLKQLNEKNTKCKTVILSTNGITFLKHLNEQNIKIKTVILSSEDEGTSKIPLKEKTYYFLEKPVEIQDLESTITRALQVKIAQHSLSAQNGISKASSHDANENKINTNKLLRMVKELPFEQRLKFISQLIETIEDVEELEDIGYKVESQIQIASDVEAEKEELLFENQQREMRGETPLIFVENGWLEKRYMIRKLASGEKRRYGPYYYLRWREGGELKSKSYGKQDPRPIISSNIPVYEIDPTEPKKSSSEKEISTEPKRSSSEKEISTEKRTEARTFRLDLDRHVQEKSLLPNEGAAEKKLEPRKKFRLDLDRRTILLCLLSFTWWFAIWPDMAKIVAEPYKGDVKTLKIFLGVQATSN